MKQQYKQFNEDINILTNAIKINDKITAIQIFNKLKNNITLLKYTLFNIALDYVPNIHLLNNLYLINNDIEELYKYVIILCNSYKIHDHIKYFYKSCSKREKFIKSNKLSLISPCKNDLLETLSDKLYIHLCRNQDIEYINAINNIKNTKKYDYIKLYKYCNKNYKFLCCLNVFITKYYKYCIFKNYYEYYYDNIINNITNRNTTLKQFIGDIDLYNYDNSLSDTNTSHINLSNELTNKNELSPTNKDYLEEHKEEFNENRLIMSQIEKAIKFKQSSNKKFYKNNKYKTNSKHDFNKENEIFNKYKDKSIKELKRSKDYYIFQLRNYTIYYNETDKPNNDKSKLINKNENITNLSNETNNIMDYDDNITITPFITNKLLSMNDIKILYDFTYNEDQTFKYLIVNINTDVINNKLFNNIKNLKNVNITNNFILKGPYKNYTKLYKEITANKIIKLLMKNHVTKKYIVEIDNKIYTLENIQQDILNNYIQHKKTLDEFAAKNNIGINVLYRDYLVHTNINKYNNRQQKQYLKILLLKNILGCNDYKYYDIIYFNDNLFSINDIINMSKKELSEKHKSIDKQKQLSDNNIHNSILTQKERKHFKEILEKNKRYIEILTNSMYKTFSYINEENSILDNNDTLFYGFTSIEKSNIITYIKNNITKYNDINNWIF